jgi:hypothetical protein
VFVNKNARVVDGAGIGLDRKAAVTECVPSHQQDGRTDNRDYQFARGCFSGSATVAAFRRSPQTRFKPTKPAFAGNPIAKKNWILIFGNILNGIFPRILSGAVSSNLD